MMNGVLGSKVAYDTFETSMPTYPFAPPPRVQGTEQALAFIQRSSWWSLSNVGSPRTLGRILCSKNSAFKSVLDAMMTCTVQ